MVTAVGVVAAAVLGAGPAAAVTPALAVLGTIQDSGNPSGMAVDPSTHAVYVANSNAGTVSVIRGTASKVTATIRVGSSPSGVAVDPSARALYVANGGAGTVSVIRGTAAKVTATIRIGHPSGVAVDPSTHAVYVTNDIVEGRVLVIRGIAGKVTAGKVIAAIPVGSFPSGVAVDPSTHAVYVANVDDGTVSVIDGVADKVTATITVGSFPSGVAVDPSTHTVYVANGGGGTVSVIDGTTDTVTATIPVGSFPEGVAVEPSAHTVYVANSNGNTVSVIDGATSTVTATIPVGTDPSGVAVDPRLRVAYVANSGDGTVSVIGRPVGITSPAAGSSTGQTPAITGTGLPGAAITLTETSAAVTGPAGVASPGPSGAMIGQATVRRDGTWTVTPASLLPAGPATITATQAINATSAITTTASVSFTILPTGPTPTPAPSVADVRVVDQGPARARAGGIISYRVRVANQGPDVAGAVVIRDQVSRFLVTAGPLPRGCSLSHRVITCQAETLRVGQVRVFGFSARVQAGLRAGTRIGNCATASSDQTALQPAGRRSCTGTVVEA